MRGLPVYLAAVALLAFPAFGRTRVVRQISSPWLQPRCEQIAGLPWVRYIDAERRVHQSDPQFEKLTQFVNVPETQALAAAAAANVMFATMTDGSIFESADAGCTWTLRARVPEVLAGLTTAPRIHAQHLSRVYISTETKIVRLTHATVETFAYDEPATYVDVDPKNANHLHAFTKFGNVMESRDGAATWTRVGSLGIFTQALTAATDPRDFEHMLAATQGGLMLESTDGGRTWTKHGLQKVVVHSIAFSPADSSVIWADAYDGLAHSAGLYFSEDGGATFRLVDKSTRRADFSYGGVAPHPTNARRVGISPGLGTATYTPDGLEIAIFADNTDRVIWSPAGTMFYVVRVIRSL